MNVCAYELLTLFVNNPDFASGTRPGRDGATRDGQETLDPEGTTRKKYMSVISEFKEFAVKGNVVDMAVGIIMVPPSAK